jgi:hypothetical protein
MEGKERFAKCFVIIVEKCKLWNLQFAEKRIQQDHNGQTLKQFINSSYELRTHKIVKQALHMSSSADLDISALYVVIQIGKLLRPGEEKFFGHQNNTHGDQVDRIRQIRNSFMRIAEATLNANQYDDYIKADFKNIGMQFERINGERNGTYTKQIEEIHDTHGGIRRVEDRAPVEEMPTPPHCQCYY